jgi:hypothetical protein
VVGISYSDYLQLTPKEADDIIKAHQENKLEEFKLYETIMYNAVGQAFGGGGKFKSVFKSEEERKPIDLEERRRKAKKLRTMFGEVN